MNTTQTIRPAWRTPATPWPLRSHLAALFLACLTSLVSGSDFKFHGNFNSGLPPQASLLGDAVLMPSGGVEDSGFLRLTQANAHQEGVLLIDPSPRPETIAGFDVSFKALIGGGNGADGLSFCFGRLITNGTFARFNANGTPVGIDGFTIDLDTYQNPHELAPAIRVACQGSVVDARPMAELRKNRFVDVVLRLNPDRTLDVRYDQETIISRLPIAMKHWTGLFVFRAGTGTYYDNHFLDDLSIVLMEPQPKAVKAYEPIYDAGTRPLISVQIQDDPAHPIKTDAIRLTLDEKDVAADLATNNAGGITVSHVPDDSLAPGSLHTVSVACPVQGEAAIAFTYHFRISSQIKLNK